MTNPTKELNVACNYLLRLMKAHVQLSNEQKNLFKRVFYEILSKRYVDHWFPAAPHRGSAYRCLQTKHWKDPTLKSIAERSCLPLHRYLPAIFTIWIDPGEVAVCFGDEGTWCPLYKDDNNGQIHQEYSDGEETASSLSSDDDLVNLTQNVQTLNVNETDLSSKKIQNSNNSRTSSPFFNSNNDEQKIFWSQQLSTTYSNQQENFSN